MADNHMVFFAEIAFIYGGNDSSEKDVFGSERSSEKLWFDVGIKRYTTLRFQGVKTRLLC